MIFLGGLIVFLGVLALGSALFSRYLSSMGERIGDYTLLIVTGFCLALLLNAYVCPYKRPLKTFVKGALITVVAWVGAVTGFALYLKISNLTKLYGALSVLIVFLLWLYVLMICFVAGVIFNSETVVLKKERKRKKSIKEQR